MKTVLKVYMWIMYILAAPFALVCSLIVVPWCLIKSKGGLGFVDGVKAFVEGCKEGHRINMENIDEICGEDSSPKEIES